MTVDELIKALMTFPPETRVVVRGYEGGYDDIPPPLDLIQIGPTPGFTDDRNGVWGRWEDADCAEQGAPTHSAVLIPRETS